MRTSYDKRPFGHGLLTAALLLCFAARLWAAPDGALVLERANSNENIYDNATEDFISYLRGDVLFRYDDISIAADSAVWRKNDGIVDFTSHITVEHKGQIMTCERLYFVKGDKLLTASGGVLYRDSAKITYINGSTAEYMTDRKECTLRGDPLLTRVDSASADTLFIRGRTMVYNDSTKIANINDNVRINRGELSATSRRGEYSVKKNIAKLRVNPVINYEKHIIVGDSVDLFFGKETFEGACVMGNTHGRYTEASDSTGDTTVADIWSDSMSLSMHGSKKVNSMKAFGNARGKHSQASAPPGSVATTDIASDSLQVFMFEETGKIREMKAFGNATGNYRESPADTSKSAMSTNITSDSLRVSMFETGKIGSMTAFGRAHGRNAEWGAAGAKDSLITHIWSDSLRVRMSDASKIQSMRAFGNVRSKNFAAGDSALANEVSGRTLMLVFGDGGKVEKAIVMGGAKSVYFIDEADGGGCNVAGGERITVTFRRGKAQKLKVWGGAKGIYYP
jgi:lipopolysaccharide export system protein LptA